MRRLLVMISLVAAMVVSSGCARWQAERDEKARIEQEKRDAFNAKVDKAIAENREAIKKADESVKNTEFVVEYRKRAQNTFEKWHNNLTSEHRKMFDDEFSRREILHNLEFGFCEDAELRVTERNERRYELMREYRAKYGW